mmetsp:Transcript_89988/g.226346  ORF Transcript_89988/g.226346 Transcript_89988/m.226346 type:complete len:229 (+) Transcript_89988:708-1394(+)
MATLTQTLTMTCATWKHPSVDQWEAKKESWRSPWRRSSKSRRTKPTWTFTRDVSTTFRSFSFTRPLGSGGRSQNSSEGTSEPPQKAETALRVFARMPDFLSGARCSVGFAVPWASLCLGPGLSCNMGRPISRSLQSSSSFPASSICSDDNCPESCRAATSDATLACTGLMLCMSTWRPEKRHKSERSWGTTCANQLKRHRNIIKIEGSICMMTTPTRKTPRATRQIHS